VVGVKFADGVAEGVTEGDGVGETAKTLERKTQNAKIKIIEQKANLLISVKKLVFSFELWFLVLRFEF